MRSTTRAAIHLVRYSLLFAGTQGVCAILICTLNYWTRLCNTFRPRLHLILMKHYVTIYQNTRRTHTQTYSHWTADSQAGFCAVSLRVCVCVCVLVYWLNPLLWLPCLFM